MTYRALSILLLVACGPAEMHGGAVDGSTAPADAASLDGGSIPDAFVRTEDADVLAVDADVPPDASSITTDAGDVRADAGADAGTFAPIPCMAPPAIVCDDFEGDLSQWTPYTGADGDSATGTLAIDRARAASGSGSVHASVTYRTLGSGWAELRRPLPLPDTLHVRMRVLVPASGLNSWYTLALLYSSRGFASAGVGLVDGHLATTGWGDSGIREGTDAEAWPTDRWVCLEWSLTRSGAGGSIDVWRDGTQVIDGASVAQVGELDAIFLGPYGSGNDPGTVDVWIDDVGISTERLGCGGGT